MQLLKIQLTSYQEKEGEEESFVEEIKKLQSATDKDKTRDKIVQGLLSQNGKLKGKLSVADKMMVQLQKELEQKDQTMQQEQASLAESKQEIELLQEKITTMTLQQIERDKQVQEKKHTKFQQKTEYLRRKDFILFEDDIYGEIIIDHPLIIKIIQTRQFQRLRNINSLGYTYQNVTKANFSKLQQSIGMYFLAGEYVKQLQRKQPELNITDSDVLCIQIAALCFNLGVGPFSHSFEMFLYEICQKQQIEKPWDNVSEASVKMFEYMLEDNVDLMVSFKEYFDNLEENLAFIKELMREKRKMQCIQDKEFLYEIILNESQMNVKVIDYTTRDAAVLGIKLSFKWRVFLAKVRVLMCADGKLHICFHEDDIETYNDFFNTRSSLYRDLYYLRKIRIVALMIKIIFIRANDTELIPVDIDKPVTIFDATKSMAAYTHLTDSVLTLIKSTVKDHFAQQLLKCLDTLKFIAQIGYIVPPDGWTRNPNDLKEAIAKATGSENEKVIKCQLIIEPVLNGYDGHGAWKQHYYDDDESTGKWDTEWAQKKYNGSPPWRVFLVSGNRELMKTAQEGLKKVIENEKIQNGKPYPDRENFDLMPDFPITGASFNVQDHL